jgi:hypothetical protein
MTASIFLAFTCAIAAVSALVPGGIPVMRPVSAHARAVSLPVLVASTKEEKALRISQHGAVSRRAALLGAGALAFSQHTAAWAAPKAKPDPKKAEMANTLLKLTFDQSEKLAFGELGWGDAEAKLLSKALTRSTATKKLILNGNNIQDAGVAALAASLRAGDAPKLKNINLAGNSGVSEEAARALTEAREGLIVSFEQPPSKKAGSESPARALVSQGLDVNGLYKLTFAQAETLFFSELGWGNAEAEALSKELYAATSLKKLFLNGNEIQCDGALAIAASIREGSAPKLKILNLAGNRGITESDKLALNTARSGITINFVQLKQAGDADVYIRADQGKLTNKGAIERASKGELVDGSTATCTELNQIMDVDRASLKIEKNLLQFMKDPAEIKKVQDVEQALEKQIERLDGILEKKKTTKTGCNDDKARISRSTGYPVPFKGYGVNPQKN